MNGARKNAKTNGTKRAVLYARVSSDDRGNNGRNLDGQLEMCREYALKNGWPVLAELAEDDRGASGASFELPRLNQVLEMAQAGDFDVLVVRELDRLSRKLAKQLVVEEELKRAGVQIEYVLGDYSDTPEGNLMKNIRAVIAEYERLKINERMTRGRRQKVRARNVMVSGHAPYGYQVAEVGGRTELVVHEPEARVVRLIFTWYTIGDDKGEPMSIGAIARKLSAMGIPTYADTATRPPFSKKLSKRGHWSRASVHNMLKNETYIGVWRYGKRNIRDGKWVRNPDEHQLKVTVPAIISPEMWKTVQARLAENRGTAGSNAKYQYLMRGRLTCGTCGLKMRGMSVRRKTKVDLYYRCPAGAGDREYVRDCDSPVFRADQVDAVVWGKVKSYLTDPEALARGLREYQAEKDKDNKLLQDRLGVVDDLLARNQAEMERLLDLYVSGEFPKDMLTDRKARIAATLEALGREQASLIAHLEEQTLTNSQIKGLQDFAAQVAEGLGAMDDDFQVKRRVMETLDVRVTLSVEDERKIVSIQCVLHQEDRCFASNETGAIMVAHPGRVSAR